MADDHTKVLLRDVGEAIGEHLAAIAQMYSEPVFITLVVRNPAHPEGSRDTMLTNDPDTEAAKRVITQIAGRPAEDIVVAVHRGRGR